MTESVADAEPSTEKRQEFLRTLELIIAESENMDTTGRKGRPILEWDGQTFVVRWVPVEN